MGTQRIAIICAWLLLTATAAAQDAAPKGTTPRGPQPKELPPLNSTPASPVVTAPSAEPVAAPMELAAPSVDDILWFRTDYILWQLPRQNIPFPIVTTGNPADDCFGGVIGQPGTGVLFGNQNVSNNNTGGLRVLLGGWLDNAHDFGVEANGFVVLQENHTFSFSSDKSGNPGLYLSAYNTQLGREDSAIIADPIQQFGGSIQVATGMRFFGTELNTLFNLKRNDVFEWTFLSGVRYLDLRESLSVSAVSRDLVLNQHITLDDQFKTANQFLGYQIGSRMRWRSPRWMLDLTGKVALGGNRREVTISGQSTSGGPDATNPGTYAGGFYAQPSNIGRDSNIALAVVPAAEVRIGFFVLPRVIASVGYDILYLNQTVRATNQVDRNLNLSQSPVLGSPTPDGPAGPRRQFDSSDFFVHGLSVGLEIRY